MVTIFEMPISASLAWSAAAIDGPLSFQCSAHGQTRQGQLEGASIIWDVAQPKVAVGQSIAIYVDDVVVGGGTAGGWATDGALADALATR